MYNYYDPNCKHAGKGRYTELQIGPVPKRSPRLWSLQTSALNAIG